MSKNSLKPLFTLFLLLQVSVGAMGQVSIDDTWQYEYLEELSKVLPVNDGETVEDELVLNGDLNHRFIPFDLTHVKGERTTNWLKFKIKNLKPKKELLYLGSTRFEELTFWLKRDSLFLNSEHSGQNVAISEKPVEINGLSFFKFELGPGDEVEVLLKAENFNASTLPQVVFPLILTTERYFVSNYEKPGDYTYLFLGAVIIMFIFNLLLFFTTRVKLYLYSAGYVLFITLFCLGLIPQFAYPLYGHMDINRVPINWGGTISALFYCLVASETMELKKYFPRANKFIYVLIMLYLLTLITSFFPSLMVVTSSMNFAISFLMFPTVFVLGLNRFFSNHTPSRFFFLAILIYSVGVMILLLSLTNVLPPVVFGLPAVTLYQIGIVSELALFSLGIGGRINEMENLKNMEEIERLRADQLVKEKEQTRKLLLNTLPESTVDELMKNGKVEPRLYEEVTILFMDIVGFTNHVEKISPQELIKELHYYYKTFDTIVTKYDIEKIKTIGDAYLAVCGIPEDVERQAQKVIMAAIEIMDFMEAEKLKHQKEGKDFFELRVGIHTGSVIAGLVGITKFAYDIWGDTVNIAARMEQKSEPGRINISESTYNIIKNEFNCTPRGKIEAKNKGKIDMYFLDSKNINVL